ncbi:MAG: hypothetical protein ACE5H1_08760 [Thermodesulfobacteriota bacterium]
MAKKVYSLRLHERVIRFLKENQINLADYVEEQIDRDILLFKKFIKQKEQSK